MCEFSANRWAPSLDGRCPAYRAQVETRAIGRALTAPGGSVIWFLPRCIVAPLLQGNQMRTQSASALATEKALLLHFKLSGL